jgi:beta-phosphoglucomutase-like phosphatase (HAD superfamily)
MENQSYTHILQKKGILKAFSVAKIVRSKDIEELKSLIKTLASSEKEYDELLKEELQKLSNMHDENNPIPGIIYVGENMDKRNILFAIAQKFSDNIKLQKFDKQQLAFLITIIITKLNLNQEDFMKLNEDMSKEMEEEDEEDED